ncbi:radial spoke head 10 homolog B isoform X3 [Ascaphus truei]|uniref:radial spoke head 10 homolog B isoform X3 n=1 Tax=Ascaphus truei TaxID=8439 RepID=UPI003F59C5E5
MSSVSVRPTEELPPASITYNNSDQPMMHKESPIIVATPESYEEPILTQLIVDKYEGEMVYGLYEADGVAYFKGGNTYRGMFSEGLMHGKGTYTWADGLIYEGDFCMNVPMGHGTYIWPDGSRYEGQVHKGVRHGTGMYTSGNQQVSYVGEWYYSSKHGQGTMFYNKDATSWYEGNWENNKKENWGVRCYKSGDIYEGNWNNNVRHGMGTMRWLSCNEEFTGQWVNGMQNGFGTYSWILKRVPGSQYPLKNEYVGNFVNGVRQGNGLFYYANGAIYDGEWKDNKKHGMGKFIFKNGQIYSGEFVKDQIAEYPNIKFDSINTPNLSGIRTESAFSAEHVAPLEYNSGIPRLLGSDIELDISALLCMFPEKERWNEMNQVELAVLRHITQLRKIYYFYSRLGNDNSSDNTFLMTKLQFWRFLKDCRFHHYNITLSEMDLLLIDHAKGEGLHSPHTTMLLRTFLTNIIYLAYHVCPTESLENISLVDCFSKMMTENILPHACRVKGCVFVDPEKTKHAMLYIDKCWDIYKIYCHQNSLPPHEPVMKMRHFIWMLKDLEIINKEFTATDIVDILAEDNPSVRNGHEANLELEKLKLRSEYLPGQSLRNSFRSINKGRATRVPFLLTKNLEQEVKTNKWIDQIDIFLWKQFFPSHEYAERLKEEILKNRTKQAVLTQLLKIKDEEDRLKALRKAEEVKRLEQMEAEKTITVMELVQVEPTEDKKTAQIPTISKEDPPTPPPPSSTKAATAAGRKRKEKVV